MESVENTQMDNLENINDEETLDNNEEVVEEEEIISVPSTSFVEEAQLELLKLRIPYDEDIFESERQYMLCLVNLLTDSKYIALSIRFPFEDYSNMELPKWLYNWQIRCSVEIYQMLGKENIKSYSENGLGWTRDGGNISNDLKDEIMPLVGVIKKDDIEPYRNI